jgi:hypothetical protein
VCAVEQETKAHTPPELVLLQKAFSAAALSMQQRAGAVVWQLPGRCMLLLAASGTLCGQ